MSFNNVLGMTGCICLRMRSYVAHFCTAPRPGLLVLGSNQAVWVMYHWYVSHLHYTVVISPPISSIMCTPLLSLPHSTHSLIISDFYSILSTLSLPPFSPPSSFSNIRPAILRTFYPKNTPLPFVLCPGFTPFHPVLFLVILTCKS